MPSKHAEHTIAVTLLAGTDTPGRVAHLLEHSGPPSARANLPLVHAYAEVADLEEARAFAAGEEEYLALCGAAALGARSAEPAVRADAARAARDDRRRVREGVALGLQRLGRARPAELLAVLAAWRESSDPLVQRARVAAVCEPALLGDALLAAAALVACAEATEVLRAVPPERRCDPGVRTLRQALGSCWSIAVAADPEAGLPEFARLSRDDDPDVAWIVRRNRSRTRLKALLPGEHDD